MKDTDQVFEAIQHLATLSGKEKEHQLQEYLQDALFEKVVKAAYCPFTTFGVKKYEKCLTSSSDAFDEKVWDLLERLSERKTTGNSAIAECSTTYGRLSEESAELFDRILQKDLRAGFSAKTVNKVKPNTIFVFECMLAHKYEPKRIKKFPVAVELKLDGVRVIAMRVPSMGGDYRFFSRTGKEFEAYRHLGVQLDQMTPNKLSMVFDGEVVDSSGSFNETVGAAHRKNQAANAIFNVFDVHYFNVFNSGDFELPYIDRKRELEELCLKSQSASVRYHGHYIANSHSEVMAMYQRARDNNLEGIIVKPLDGQYTKKRSYNWLKVKDEQTVDVLVVGFEPGTGKFEHTLGALVVDYKGTKVNVGSGLTDADREYFWQNRPKYLNCLVEVEFHEETADGSLRHPRFVRLRGDKPVEDGVGC